MSRLTPLEHRHANVNDVDIDKLTPYGDLVLARKLAAEEPSEIIAVVRDEPDRGLLRAEVVATGLGDQLSFKGWKFRAPMNVRRGDEILYTRTPANDIDIKGVPHVFLHEESQIVA